MQMTFARELELICEFLKFGHDAVYNEADGAKTDLLLRGSLGEREEIPNSTRGRKKKKKFVFLYFSLNLLKPALNGDSQIDVQE